MTCASQMMRELLTFYFCRRICIGARPILCALGRECEVVNSPRDGENYICAPNLDPR